MSGFKDCRAVEARGMVVLLPFLKERAYDGRLVLTSKGPLSRALQESVGDALMNSNEERVWGLEFKIEERHTGNLFLETWSNLNLDDRRSHAERGSNVGWLQKLTTDRLLYYFLDTDDLYDFDLFSLQRWAFRDKRIYSFEEKPQRKSSQMNDTWGRIVPIASLKKELPRGSIRWCRPKQVELFDTMVAV